MLHLDNGKVVTYNDPRRFGFMDLAGADALDRHPRLAELGDEPLAAEFDGARLAALFAGSRAPLKSALLDQKRIAGLGNIYVCEALFRASLSPFRPAGGLANARGGPTKAARALAKAIRAVLEEAIEAGGSTLRDHRQADGDARLFPAPLRGLRPRGRSLPEAGLPRDDRARRAIRSLDILLSGLPEVTCRSRCPRSLAGRVREGVARPIITRSRLAGHATLCLPPQAGTSSIWLKRHRRPAARSH